MMVTPDPRMARFTRVRLRTERLLVVTKGQQIFFRKSPILLPLWAQSQCNCRSVESKKSDEKTVGEEIPAGPGIVRSNHSMLSMPVSCRWRVDGGVSVKVRSEVSIGEWDRSSSWFLSSSISLWDCGPASSSRTSNWLSEARVSRLAGGAWVWLGVRATCIRGGGRDSTVLMGRVVMFTVTGISLSREGSCLARGDISGRESTENGFVIQIYWS